VISKSRTLPSGLLDGAARDPQSITKWLAGKKSTDNGVNRTSDRRGDLHRDAVNIVDVS
jgi:hypothetical protein